MSSSWCIVVRKSSSTNCDLNAFPIFSNAHKWAAVYLALCTVNALICLLWIRSKREFLGLKYTFRRLVASMAFWSHLLLLGVSVGYDIYVIATSTSNLYAEYGYSLWISQKLSSHTLLFLLIYFREPTFLRLGAEKWFYKATLLLFAADNFWVAFGDSLKVAYKLTTSPPHNDVRDTLDIYFIFCNVVYRKMAFEIYWRKFFYKDVNLFAMVCEKLPEPMPPPSPPPHLTP